MVDLVYAMGQGGAGAPQGGGAGLLFPTIIVFVIFYFLLIWPQQKKQKKHQEMVNNLKKGDRIMTNGGIHGRITSVDENMLTLEIADKVRIKLNKGFVGAKIMPGQETKQEEESDKNSKKSK